MQFWIQRCFILASKNIKILPKIDYKSHQKNDAFLHRFLRHLGCNLRPKLGPCWLFFSAPRGGPCEIRPLFCCVAFLNRFFFWIFASRADGVPQFWPPRSDGVPQFCSIFEHHLIPTWRYLGPLCCKSCSLMGEI